MAGVKGETEGLAVKKDPELGSQMDGVIDAADDDIYEDAGDLDFTDAAKSLLLVKVPNWLWKTWEDMGEDQEIQIGTVRVEGDLKKPKRMSLKLESTGSQRPLPKEFNMNITNDSSSNTFVFSEKDLPGYNSRSRGRANFGNGGPFSHAAPRLSHDRYKNNDNKVDKVKRGPYYRKGIPKRTTFAGQVGMEVNCLPVQNKEYYDYLDVQRRGTGEADRGPIVLTGQAGLHGGNILNPGALGASNFEAFTVKGAVSAKSKGQEFKAARIPQNELMDLLFDCFKKYRYWAMKALRSELNQPEAYLRQTLEKIAELVKSGPFAGRYRLKPGANLGDFGLDGESFNDAEEGERQAAVGGLDGASDLDDDDMSDDDEANKQDSVMR